MNYLSQTLFAAGKPSARRALSALLLVTALVASQPQVQGQALCPLGVPSPSSFQVFYNNGFLCSTNGGSYFTANIVGSGEFKAWCSDAFANIDVSVHTNTVPCYSTNFSFDQFYSATIYDSLRPSCPTLDPTVPPWIYQPDPGFSPDQCVWNEINYLLNHKKGTNPDAIQAAIWDLISPANQAALDTLPTFATGAPPNPQASQDRADMVTEAKAHSGFIPGPGEVRGAILSVDENIQVIFIEILCPACDLIPPTFTKTPTNSVINLGCNPTVIPDCDLSQVAATDAAGPVTITCSSTNISNGCGRTRIITYIATDICGNTSKFVQTITWTFDKTAPTITCANNKTVECNQAWTFDAPTATDGCSTPTITILSTTTNAVGCGFTATRTWMATDACGNTATCSQTVQSPGCLPCVPSTFNFNGSSALSGSNGNVRVFTTNGVSVKVTAFSRVKAGGAWSSAYLGLYGGGLGVTDSSEGAGANNSHTVDNIDRDNYVLFEFSQPVVLSRASLGYVVSDSDLTLWIGTAGDPFNNHLTLSDALLSGFYTEDNLTDSTTTRTADLNAGALQGNVVVIAAWPGDDTPEDQFKIAALDVCKRQCQSLKLECVGTSGQVNTPYSSSLVASGGTSPYTFAIISGSLPPGLTLNPTTGAITGSPTTPGNFTFTAKVTDSLGATATSVCSAGCSPTTTTFDFLSPLGTLGTSQSYTANGLTITARGYLNNGTPTALYGKNGGGDENGLGIAATSSDHEITVSNFVQLDLTQIIASGASSATISIGSVQTGEGYSIYGSHVQGSIGTLLVNNGQLDNIPFAMPGFPTYEFISVRAAAVDVLLGAVTFTSGGCSITIAPSPALGSICGSVLRDCDANGSLTGEAGLAGWTVTLKNGTNVVGTKTTAADGSYCFSTLAAGTYSVVVTPQASYSQTVDPDATLDHKTSITLSSGQNKTGVNFGYTGTAAGVNIVVTGPASAYCGDTITYTFAVTNTGNTCLYGGMSVNDPLLGGQIFYQSPVTPGSGFVFQKTYVVKSTDSNPLVNTATAVGGPPGGLASVSKQVSVSTAITCAKAPPAPTCLTGTAGSCQVNLSWLASSGATSYNVKRSTTKGGPYTVIKTGATTTNYTDTAVTNGVVYYYVVCAVKNGLASADSNEDSEIPSAGLPSPAYSKDIGAVADAGASSYSAGKVTVVGSGADIWGTADEFQFAYQAGSGDCTVIARVASIQNTDPWAKAGVMIRETLTAGSKHASVLLTPGNGAVFEYRSATSGSSLSVNAAGLTAPYWLKIVRSGNTFSGYRSPNGAAPWTLIGSQTITMGASVYIGLAVTSHNDGTLCTAVFDNVTGTP